MTGNTLLLEETPSLSCIAIGRVEVDGREGVVEPATVVIGTKCQTRAAIHEARNFPLVVREEPREVEGEGRREKREVSVCVCEEPLAHHPPIKLNDLVFLPMHLLHFQPTTHAHTHHHSELRDAVRRVTAWSFVMLKIDIHGWCSAVQRSAACCCCSRCPCLTVTHPIQSPVSR